MKKANVDMALLKGLNKDAAGVVKGAALPSAPRRSGKLSNTLRTGATQRAGIVRAGKKAVPYGNPIHWGWKSRNIEAQPWITNAAKASESQWLDVYLDGIKDILDKIKGV